MSSTPTDRLPFDPFGSLRELRRLPACLMLGSQLGAAEDTALIEAALVPWLGDARKVKVIAAVGALLDGNAAIGQAELARERLSGEADAGTLVFAMADRLAGDSDEWRTPVDRVLATSVDPTLRSIAYAIEGLASR